MSGIGSWVSRRALRTPEAIALVDGATGASTSYGDLAQRCRARAGSLRSRGVKQGDRVMVVASNSVAMMEVLFATAHIGAIFVPINYRLSAAEVTYLIDDTAPALLIHDDAWADLAARAADSSVVKPPVTHIRDLDAPDCDLGEQPVSSGDVAMIMYTSGTTGHPKGAMLTHGNFEANAINMLTAGKGVTREDSTLVVAPLFHVGALGLYAMPVLYAGGTVVIQDAFIPDETLELMARHRITLQFMVPTMWDALSKVPNFDEFDLSSLRCLLCGGAPCPIPVIDFYQGKGFTFMEGFGMTELSPTALVLEAEFVKTRAGSVGRPFLHTDVRIVDEGDRDVATGEVGELVLQGPNVFAGYWGLPEATAQAKRGGWFHSGDLARQDADGFVTIVDRKKDMVISGGENVYPIEVERVLSQHPDVVEAAVIGLLDDKWGESVVAVLVMNEGASRDDGAIIEYCRERIAKFKCPRRIEYVEALPRNATGKLLKRDLREQFGADSAVVSR